MLSDIELFIVTWLIAGVALFSLFGIIYPSRQLWMLKRNLHATGQGFPKDTRLTERGAIRLMYLSALILILSSVVGWIISFINWIPIAEYNLDTVVFRMLSVNTGTFLVLLVSGALIIYLVHGVMSGD